MKWQGREGSSNVSRGSSGGGPVKIGGVGLLLLVIVYSLFGGNPRDIINEQNRTQQEQQVNKSEKASSKEVEEAEKMLSVVLKDTEDVWHEKFSEINKSYNEPKLHFFEGAVSTGCGNADKNVGPFYCSLDQTVYMDVTFYNMLTKKLGADGGDYAMAYVLAHEVGHHVQKELGILDRVHNIQRRLNEKDANKYSVALEIQADYFAGVFSYYIKEKGYLEEGDIEEAISAVQSVGDDHIQKMGQGYVQPEKFTHGSSELRIEWFQRGFKYHDFEHADSFGEMGLRIQ